MAIFGAETDTVHIDHQFTDGDVIERINRLFVTHLRLDYSPFFRLVDSFVPQTCGFMERVSSDNFFGKQPFCRAEIFAMKFKKDLISGWLLFDFFSLLSKII